MGREMSLDMYCLQNSKAEGGDEVIEESLRNVVAGWAAPETLPRSNASAGKLKTSDKIQTWLAPFRETPTPTPAAERLNYPSLPNLPPSPWLSVNS